MRLVKVCIIKLFQFTLPASGLHFMPYTSIRFTNRCITWMHKAVDTQMALAALRLLGKQMALKSLIPAYFASACNSERFLCT